ncbi:presenilins-associated rhomboid-like protein, mitochondrial [Phlebotomus papatasi]|uniref:presenilins-associated rhomboid-like protein, mitochondrial n=1 Tax=Phlebotomus papatasi TaxID=29031 RepID=UPI002483CE3E|nr:presenilins-associated rhomboid-like protein, mitochondrial [Phlebotomus papatasi]
MILRHFSNASKFPVLLRQNPGQQPLLHRSTPSRINWQSRQFKNESRGGSERLRGSQQSLAPTPTPFDKFSSDGGHMSPQRLWKPLVFTLAVSTGSFVSVTIWEYERVRARILRSVKGSAALGWFKSKAQGTQKRATGWRLEVENWWRNLPEGDKVFIPICAMNLLVFGLWRVPRLQPMMVKYFCSNPAARAICWPMFLSTFSHYSLFHIFANMYVLRSFSGAAIHALGREQFVGLYLSAGVVSSLASYIYKTGVRQAGLSLGASGAIMAILAFVCTQFPDTQLSIIFLPMFTFSAGTAIKCIMGLDMAGLVMGWKIFDHAAHLGGALFGLFWYYYGSLRIWPRREVILREYHKIREERKK